MTTLNKNNIESNEKVLFSNIFGTVTDARVILNYKGRTENELYHFGASLKDLGKKLVVSEAEPWFAFSRMDSLSKDVLKNLKKGGNNE